MPDHSVHPASYRDPSGFVFRAGDLYYRQVNRIYAEHYQLLMSSGCYEALTTAGLLISHRDTGENLTGQEQWYKTLLPAQLPFVSQPVEWSPAQLQDAALLTLTILRLATGHGMILKDATPFNVQFVDGKPLFIDTLSFERYDESKPWIAYRQFCETFLFPLYLHHYLGTGTHPVLRAWPEGIPAQMTARLLPMKSRFSLGVWLHVRLQGSIQAQGRQTNAKSAAFSRQKLHNLIRNLEEIIGGLDMHEQSPTEWNNYYASTILSTAYLQAKEDLFRTFTNDLDFSSALDLGANDGHFSRILAEKNATVLAADADWNCINRLYRITKEQRLRNVLPLCIDLAHPSPATGFHNRERAAFSDRAISDLVIALALVHHLTITRNIPMTWIAAWLSEITGKYLVIEFIPPDDKKVLELTRSREQFHTPCDAAAFEASFSPYFTVSRQSVIPNSSRILYLMKKNKRT